MPPKRASTRASTGAKDSKPATTARATKARTTSAAAPKKPLREAKAKANTSAKRKADADTDDKKTEKKQKRVAEPAHAEPAAKKRKTEVKEPKRVAKKEVKKEAKKREVKKEVKKKEVKEVKKKEVKKEVVKEKIVINKAPTTRLEVFVFGSNSNGELALGGTFKKAECPRPEPNSILAEAGVVQIATGGMHGVALTHDNKILTWGVNDLGALGRDTAWEGGLVDIDKAEEEESDEEAEIEVNPREATPTQVDLTDVEEGTVFTQVAAADSASFALTDDGRVYGWGTFRGSNGVFGFSPEVEVQRRPALIPSLQKVQKIAAGSNHVLALTTDGTVYAWGCGEQDQLGRRMVERRRKEHALTPHKVGLRKGIVDIAAGSDHSFAMHKDGTVYSWGLNNYGQTGIGQNAGESEATVLKPAIVRALKERKGDDSSRIVQLVGGNFNSIAVTEKNECLVWGRLDNYATGLDLSTMGKGETETEEGKDEREDVIYDDRGRPRILTVATPLPNLKVRYAALGTEHAIAITTEGRAVSWGFNSSYQTGHPTDEDVKVATVVNSKAVREKTLIWAGAGGQYGMVAAELSS